MSVLKKSVLLCCNRTELAGQLFILFNLKMNYLTSSGLTRWQILTYFAAFRSISQHSSEFSAATTLKFGMDIYNDQNKFSR